MKRFFVFLLILLSISSACADTIDLSMLTYEEKLELYVQLDQYFDRSVTLPEGVYHVGTDIAPGWYHFRYGSKSVVSVHIGTALNSTKTEIDYYNTTVDQKFSLFNPTSQFFFFMNLSHTYKCLQYGQYIVVDGGDVVIEPWDCN